MLITLHVSLLSGRTVQIETGLDVDVGEFKRRAQRALSVGKSRLVHPSGSVLNEAMTIGDSELCTGDLLHLQMQPITIQATGAYRDAAFAVVFGDGSVVTWGSADNCGNSQQQCGTRSTEECAADSSQFHRFCSHACRWIRGDLGSCCLRWQRQCGARSTEECAADSSQ